MDFEDYDTIEIREGTNLWGPYSFDLSSSLPSGDNLAAVSVMAYAGRYKPNQAVEDQTEITLVDPEYTVNYTTQTVMMKFQYPGDAYKGKATVVITATLSSGAVYPFFFHGIKVR